MKRIIDGIEIGAVIFCEDVRQEANGKWTILGAFPGEIVIPEFPANLRIALYVESYINKPYKGPLNVRFRLDDDPAMVAQGILDAEVGSAILPVGPTVIGFRKVGILRIDVGTTMENWIEVASKQLKHGIVKDGQLILSNE